MYFLFFCLRHDERNSQLAQVHDAHDAFFQMRSRRHHRRVAVLNADRTQLVDIGEVSLNRLRDKIADAVDARQILINRDDFVVVLRKGLGDRRSEDP